MIENRNPTLAAPAARRVHVGVTAGLIGGVCIWIYEAIVWVGVQHQMPLEGIPANATGLVFGASVQAMLGLWASLLGMTIHFLFAGIWGIILAAILPNLLKLGYEASLVALFYAVVAWIIMHVAIALVSTNHPDYLNSNIVIGGIMSHFFFTVPTALIIKKRLHPLCP